MKKMILLTSVLFSTQVFAAAMSCADKAEKAAAAIEAQHDPEKIKELDTQSKLIRKDKTVLVYEVEVIEGYSNGSESGEFVSTYMVTAIGSEENCRVITVRIKN